VAVLAGLALGAGAREAKSLSSHSRYVVCSNEAPTGLPTPSMTGRYTVWHVPHISDSRRCFPNVGVMPSACSIGFGRISAFEASFGKGP
jgi:hypothetical protein